MADTFQARIPSLSETELRGYVEAPWKFKREAVEAALAELQGRGLEVGAEARELIQTTFRAREEALLEAGRLKPGWFRDEAGPRLGRIRAVTGAILGLGLGAALVLYRLASTAASSPFDLEPRDSKSYLRQVEMMGGKANLMASEFRLWFTGLWQGTSLAYTVFWLAVAGALVFWLVTTRGPKAGAVNREN